MSEMKAALSWLNSSICPCVFERMMEVFWPWLQSRVPFYSRRSRVDVPGCRCGLEVGTRGCSELLTGGCPSACANPQLTQLDEEGTRGAPFLFCPFCLVWLDGKVLQAALVTTWLHIVYRDGDLGPSGT